MTDIFLEGCTSRPLAAYLKALGIFRLVGEQRDAQARGAWSNGCFVLSSSLDRNGLCDFFLNVWEPTPLVSPWNAGSGFYEQKVSAAGKAVEFLCNSENIRLKKYKGVISKVKNWPKVQELGEYRKNQSQKEWNDALSESKPAILQRCRSELPEDCLPWLDAALILVNGTLKLSPLLRTGGNEGHMEYASHFMQHVETVFSPQEKQSVPQWLETSLFGTLTNGLRCKAAGQFNPGSAGGSNQGRGFGVKKAPLNPWDFILMLEGTLLFAGTLSRRSCDNSPKASFKASFPFCVDNVSAGFASSGLDTGAAGELWLPIWSRPASLREVRRLLGDGRAALGRQQAVSGLDFARAVALLGVERRIDCFERYSFLERRGQSYVALPSGTLPVRYQSEVDQLEPVVRWQREKCRKKEEPAKLTSARRCLAGALFSCVRTPDAHHFQEVSRALAHMDALPNLSSLLGTPCSGLTEDWIVACDNGIAEVRIAAALASLGKAGELGSLRAQIAPINPEDTSHWANDKHKPQSTSWTGSTLEGIGNIFLHRLLLGQRYGVTPLNASIKLHPADLLPLIQGTLDLPLLHDLLRAFSLMSFKRKPQDKFPNWKQPLQSRRLPYAVSLLKLLYTPLPKNCGLDTERLHPEVRIARLVQTQRLEEACVLAAQRIRIAGGSALYLPTSFAESVRGLSPASVLACLAVPVKPYALLSHLYQYSAERSLHVAG